jgi:antitoxin PrlF
MTVLGKQAKSQGNGPAKGQAKGQAKPGGGEKDRGTEAAAKPRIIEASAKLTAKNQTTIPTPVRSALGLEPMDRIKFQILPDGRVELVKAADPEEEEVFDPMVLAFLDFIEADIIANPQMLTVLQDDPELRELLKDVELDENFS